MKQLNEVVRMQQLAGITEIKVNNPFYDPFKDGKQITINNQKESNRLIEFLNSGNWKASTITDVIEYDWNSDPFIQTGDFIPFDIWVDSNGGLIWDMDDRQYGIDFLDDDE
jgi:hypothetical protein